jgi:hypothetical protein
MRIFMRFKDKARIILTSDRGRGLVATTAVAKGKPVIHLRGSLKEAGKVTDFNRCIQLSENLFYEAEPESPDNFINHHCEPNCYLDFEHLCFKALRDISKGEELSFNYFTTEYDLKKQRQSFVCKCGSPNCKGRITGFKYLPLEEQYKLMDQATLYNRFRFLQSLINQPVPGDLNKEVLEQ